MGFFCTISIGSYTVRGIVSKKQMYLDEFNQTQYIRKIPYYMYFPFDTNNRPVYDLTFLYQTYCISMNAVLLTGFDGVNTIKKIKILS